MKALKADRQTDSHIEFINLDSVSGMLMATITYFAAQSGKTTETVLKDILQIYNNLHN